MIRIIKHLTEWRINMVFSRCLKALAQLQQAYFSCYLEYDYLANQFSYEKFINQKRSVWLRQVERTRNILKNNKTIRTKWIDTFSRIEHLSEIIFSLSQLRFRVKEDAIFEICMIEMRALDKALNTALKNYVILQNNNLIIASLAEAIQCFDAIFQRALQITSSEPIVFFLFIQDLNSFYNEMKTR